MNDVVIHWADYVVIFGFFVLMIAMGFVFKAFSSDTSDYFRMGCKGTWWMVGASAFMGGFSSWTYTGAAGVAFESGLSVVFVYLANIVAFIIHFLILGPWFRQMRVVTTPEVLSLRFNEVTRQFYAFTGLILFSLFTGLQLYSLAIFTSAIFGFEIQLVIIVLGAVAVVYSMSGGKWAVAGTDVLQSLLLIPLTVVIAFLALREIGGFSGLFAKVGDQGLSKDMQLVKSSGVAIAGAYTLGWGAANVVTGVMQQCSLMGAGKYFSVKDGREARKAALFAAALFILGPVIWFIPPIVARLLYEDSVLAIAIPKPAEAAYAWYSLHALPDGMVGLMAIVIFAATMSSLDTGLNGNVAVIIRDIYPTLCRKFNWVVRPESVLLKASRWISLVLGGLIIACGLYFAGKPDKGMFESMLEMVAILGIPMMVPMCLGLFIRKAPSWAALWTVGFTSIFSAIGFFSLQLFGEAWQFQQVVAVNMIAGIVGFLMTIPFWRRERAAVKDRISGFFERMKTPVNFTEEVGDPIDNKQLKIIGGFALLTGAGLGFLLLLPNPLIGKLTIIVISGFISTVGGGMFYLGSRVTRISTPKAEPCMPEEIAVGSKEC
ncbi:MAG: hypothetical protein AAF558_04065 [Verrucomicrobiota bacterium]